MIVAESGMATFIKLRLFKIINFLDFCCVALYVISKSDTRRLFPALAEPPDLGFGQQPEEIDELTTRRLAISATCWPVTKAGTAAAVSRHREIRIRL
jgi:hypothetical protein